MPPTLPKDISGPGIIYSASKITSPSLTPEAYAAWYDIHIADVLSTGIVSAAHRFKALKPDSAAPFLTIYEVPDFSAVHREAAKWNAIPMTHDLLPGGGPVQKVARSDIRYYQLLQTFDAGVEHDVG